MSGERADYVLSGIIYRGPFPFPPNPKEYESPFEATIRNIECAAPDSINGTASRGQGSFPVSARFHNQEGKHFLVLTSKPTTRYILQRIEDLSPVSKWVGAAYQLGDKNTSPWGVMVCALRNGTGDIGKFMEQVERAGVVGTMRKLSREGRITLPEWMFTSNAS